MPNLLITGGTGMLGGEIASQLAASGVTGRALVRRPERSTSLAELGFDVVNGDLSEPDTLLAALAGVDRVLLCTGDDPHQVSLQRNLIDAAGATGVRHIVKLSSHSAGLTPPVAFGVTHRDIEEHLQASGIEYTIIRPYLYMQNFMRYALNITSRSKVIAPVKNRGIALVDLRDLAAVAVHTLVSEGHAGQIYEVSGPEALSFRRATEIVSHVIGRRVNHISPPAMITRLLLRVMTDLPRWQVPFVMQLFASIRAGDQEPVTDVVTRLVGRIPRTFDEYVREHAELFSGRGSPETEGNK